MTDADATTLATQPSEDAQSEKRELALCWVFPTTARESVYLAPRMTLGRGKDCDVRLDGDGVSRRHAEIYRDGPIFAMRDLGSTNGTYLNGVRTAHSAIAPGDLLRVGCWLAVLDLLPRGHVESANLSELAPNLWGGSEFERCLRPLMDVADSELPIVLQGETGTGKERVAQAIHLWSQRSGPFRALNCAALPEQLAEGELFGYQKGAFTGAAQRNVGHLRSAHTGTLLLDEIDELAPAVQAKLLRVVQEKEVVSLGDPRPVPIDVRLVVAGQSSLAEAVKRGRFREDLRMRLSGLEVHLPPLRQRVRDIPELFSLFVRRNARGEEPTVDSKLMEALCLHDWSGNVRELELVANQIMAVHRDVPRISRDHLPAHVKASVNERTHSSLPAPRGGTPETRGDFDRQRLSLALRETDGNLSKACKVIGISRQRAYRLLDGLSIAELIQREGDDGSDDTGD